MSIALSALASGDPQTLAEEVAKRWSPRQLCRLLADPSADVRRVTAVTLGLMGDRACIGCLGRALHDEDPDVSEMAEHGLWSIWFRSGKACAVSAFSAGVALMEQEAYAQAISRFEDAVAADPEFAEAYHQCAIAHFFLGQWDESILDCQRTLERMPSHFGAMAGMGHAHLQLGEHERAVCCYRRALAIHPRQPDIRAAVASLQAKLAERELVGEGRRTQV